jgi:hypothetical protein
MKPKGLNWHDPRKIVKALNAKSLLRGHKTLGSVDDIAALEADHPATVEMQLLLDRYSLKSVHRTGYVGGPCSVIPVLGSVGWHEDPGLGTVLNWVVHIEVLNGYRTYDFDRAELLTKHGSLGLKPGGVFLFDANQGHAWLSNCACVILQATVAIPRGHKIEPASIFNIC